MSETILVIDDEPSMLGFLKQRLALEGFAVSTAGSGFDGINQANDLPPDLILLDLRMPGCDGIEVCQMLRANPKTQHIPIIVVTAVLLPDQLGQAIASGADDFAFKPIDMTSLLVRVRALLGIRSSQDAVERRQKRYTEIAREMSGESTRAH